MEQYYNYIPQNSSVNPNISKGGADPIGQIGGAVIGSLTSYFGGAEQGRKKS